MNKPKAKIYYLFHSGFAIETFDYLLIFDYYSHPTDNILINNFNLCEKIKIKKNVLVFASHSHDDHFNPEIFTWSKYNPQIKYILSSDIHVNEKNDNYYNIQENESFELDDIYIKAYGSTDIGVSFLVKVKNLSIFHAGDLNWWHWKEEIVEDQLSAEKNFKSEINKLIGEQIDIAFFPVDPRLEEFYYIGAEYFINKIKPKLLVPMHFADNYSITKLFSEKIQHISISSMAQITERGQEILFY